MGSAGEAPTNFWLDTKERGYRFEVYLPRELNKKLEELQRKSMQQLKKHVTKSSLVVGIISQFFDKNT